MATPIGVNTPTSLEQAKAAMLNMKQGVDLAATNNSSLFAKGKLLINKDNAPNADLSKTVKYGVDKKTPTLKGLSTDDFSLTSTAAADKIKKAKIDNPAAPIKNLADKTSKEGGFFSKVAGFFKNSEGKTSWGKVGLAVGGGLLAVNLLKNMFAKKDETEAA